MTQISIGILAHNAERTIRSVLESLFSQTIVSHQASKESEKQGSPELKSLFDGSTLEIVIVANGCRDRTVDVCREVLCEFSKQISGDRLSWQVLEVAEAGKSNAWNLFVHSFSDPNSDYLCLMDDDIEFLQPETIARVVAHLHKHLDAWVATDLPIKHTAFKSHKNPLDHLSLMASNPVPSGICGQFYCGRAAILRQIWMPKGLPVEDGFLRAMVVTNCFRGAENPQRVQRVEGASHKFDAYVSLRDVVRHEYRLALGVLLNYALFQYLWDMGAQGKDAGHVVRCQNEKDPDWVPKYLQQFADLHAWWLVPSRMLFRRFRRQRRGLKRFLHWPISVVMFLMDAVLFARANQQIRQGQGVGYW